ncbi:MAG: UbiD family decarboxylase [Nitrososphaerales archaeon]
MSGDLRSFLEELDKSGLLIKVKKSVSSRFELASLIIKAQKANKAVFFEKVDDYTIPVVSNVVGSRRMLAMALNTSEKALLEEYKHRAERAIQPEIVSNGPVQEVIKVGEEADPSFLPIITHSEHDAGPYITAGLVVAKDPDTGYRNVSFNRMQFKGDKKFGIRMMPPQHLGIIHSKLEAASKNLEVAVIIGNHPAEMIAGSTTLPFGVDHFAFASALRSEPLKLVKCKTVDLEVPATAEIVLEGEVLANVREAEGPFADFMQYYIPVTENHVFHLKAITHRREPIYQTILAGTAEDTNLLALSREALVYGAVKEIGTECRGVSLTPNLFNAVISIKKKFEGEPKNVALAAFGAYYWLKYCIVVDEDVNPYDLNDVWWALATRSKPDTGIFIIPSARGFPRDPYNLHQAKVGIDATAPLAGGKEFLRRRVPGEEYVKLEEYL